MTLPTLIQNYKKKAVEARLMRFSSMMSQAVRLAEVEFGDRSGWLDEINNEYNPSLTNKERQEFFLSHIGKHLKINKILKFSDSWVYYLSDGSVLQFVYNGKDFYYYPLSPEKCRKLPVRDSMGRCVFMFYLTSGSKDFGGYQVNKSDDYLKTNTTFGCNATSTHAYFCTTLIQRNGWKIPDDYPFDVW